MQFLPSLLKQSLCGVMLTGCTIFSSFAQGSQPDANNVVDSAAKPQVFAEGIVSTPYSEWATSFTPDGNTVYFSQGAIYWTICLSKKVKGKWTKPEVANISGTWNDTDPFISPDGKRMIFVSSRPLPGAPKDKSAQSYHLWYANSIGDNQWSAPVYINEPVNIAGANNYAPSISSSGTLCFCSRNRGGNTGMASYSAKWLGDHFDKPQILAINGKDEVQDPFIAPDESYIVFVSGNDMFISYRIANGFSQGQKLGKAINNGDSNSSPYVSADGKMLYYSSGRIQGLYHRKPAKVLNYDELVGEMNSVFNGQGNILVIPVNLSGARPVNKS